MQVGRSGKAISDNPELAIDRAMTKVEKALGLATAARYMWIGTRDRKCLLPGYIAA